MHSPDIIKLFRRLIEREIGCSERLEEILADEQRALTARDPQVLQEALAQKQGLLRELEQSVAAHEGFLTARRLPPGKAGTRAFLSSLPQDAPEHALWQRLQEVAVGCRENNRVNGSLVALGKVRTQRALEILCGSPDNAKTYGKAGEARNAGRPRFLGSV